MNPIELQINFLFKLVIAVILYLIMRRYDYSRTESVAMPILLVIFPPIFFIVIAAAWFAGKKAVMWIKK